MPPLRHYYRDDLLHLPVVSIYSTIISDISWLAWQIKGPWPPTKTTSVETIAASFVPPQTGSAVRLFNLAMDVPLADLTYDHGRPLVANVKYTLGSMWAPVPAGPRVLTATGTAASGGGVHAIAPFTPPQAPEVFTVFLLGTKAYGYSLLPQIDAPETGPCKPPLDVHAHVMYQQV